LSKQIFRTKLTKRQRRNNILVILAVFAGLYALTVLFGFMIGMYDDPSDPEVYIISFFMVFYMSSMLVFPSMIAGILLGLQRGKARRVLLASTFVPVQDLDYYRDALDGLSPAIVSLLIDLDIYGKKDIAATLLRMQNKGVLRIDGNGAVTVITGMNKNLDKGECDLLNFIKRGWLTNKNVLRQWMKNRYEEASRLGYIKRKPTTNKYLLFIPFLLVILSIVCGFAVWIWFLTNDFFMNNGTLIGLLKITAGLLIIDSLTCIPLYLFCRWVMYNRRFRGTIWERTELGNEIAEKIAGLSRFISEFSLLSQAQKEQVVLWDDYLVYAIVLEQNEQIVKEICREYNISSRSFDKLSLYGT